MYIDYNRNGSIDPVDIGISIAAEEEIIELTEEEKAPKKKNISLLTILKQIFS